MISLIARLLLALTFVCPMTKPVFVGAVQHRQLENDCGTQVVVTKIVSLEPIYINTYVQENTTFAVNNHFFVTVTNAPTSLDKVSTDSTTIYLTGTRRGFSSIVSSPQFSYVNSYSFVLGFASRVQLRRRQTGNLVYVGSQGSAVDTCSNAVVYTLTNGQLFANASSTTTQFGMTPGATYANFTPSASPGSVTQTFSVDSSNNLMWNNIAFYNDFARFCAMPDNTIVAVFASPDQAPTGCVFVNLSLVRLTNCVSNPAGPSGPQGLSGLIGATGPQGVSGLIGATGPQGLSGLNGATGPQGLSGLVGATGLTGQVGATGPQGISGQIGATGPQGLSGLVGATGPQGISGQIGATGPQGLSGQIGATGPQGLSGQIGATGPQGLSGQIGATGPQGLSGQVGATGVSGQVGATGPQGLSGLVGATGVSGQVGATGPQGLSGQVGATGISGQVGATGPQGLSGQVGATGISGQVGATGPQGVSGQVGATGVSGQIGATGLSGQVGATGPQGISGLVGATGPQGISGQAGLSGQVGATGPQGISGLVGATGPQGISGQIGATGLSGLVGATGPQGISGLVGATGPQGISGQVGATGLSGQVGATGLSGQAGATGPSGPTGPSGVSGPSGPPGPTGAPSIQFAYLGCYQQTCAKQQTPTGLLPCFYGFDNATIFGGFNQTVQGNANANIDAQCSNICINKYGGNYFGTINSAGSTTTGDCYCGYSITSNAAVMTNCGVCSGQAVGMCGSYSQSSIAVYARAF